MLYKGAWGVRRWGEGGRRCDPVEEGCAVSVWSACACGGRGACAVRVWGACVHTLWAQACCATRAGCLHPP